jgi:Sperm-tail PG-rich repeat
MVTNNSPGPGDYNLKNTLAGPGWGFGNSQRVSKYENNIPGPGSYPIKSSMNHTSYSMVPRRPIIESIEKTPGPGSYKSQSLDKSPTFTVGKSKRQPINNYSIAPGPGAYSPEIPKSKAKNVCNVSLDLIQPPESY